MTLIEIKEYLKVDGNDDDKLIEMLQLEAEEYLTGAGIAKDYTKNRYKLAVLLLVSDGYENRQIRSDKSVNVIDRVNRIILQLQLEVGVINESGETN